MMSERQFPGEGVTCPVCKRPGRSVTSTGKIRQHQAWLSVSSASFVQFPPPCEGSGMPAEQAQGMEAEGI